MSAHDEQQAKILDDLVASATPFNDELLMTPEELDALRDGAAALRASPITTDRLLAALQHTSLADTERILSRLGFSEQEIADAIR